MKCASTTTAEINEIVAAQFSEASFKDLMKEKNGRNFFVQEAMILVPEEDKAGDNEKRMTGVLKVDGAYYKGISQKVLEKIEIFIDMKNSGVDFSNAAFQMEKSAGKYGSYVLKMVC